MEENYNQNEPAPIEKPSILYISDDSRAFLSETIKWGKFLAILGFIAAFMIFLAGLALIVFGTTLSPIVADIGMKGLTLNLMGAIYLIMGFVYYFPSRYLYDFCIYTKQALLLNDQESLDYAFSRLKSVYKFWGIICLALLVMYIVGFLLTLTLGVFLGMG